MKRYLTALCAILLLVSCTDTAPRGGGDILVLGDSVMAWNGRQAASIGDALERALDRGVTSKAVPGAHFDNGSVIAGAVGFDIQRQLAAGRWNWVVLNGGANDVSADCDCGKCGAVLDGLIDPSGVRGAIPAFLKWLRVETGAQVLWMGYYAGNGKGSFEGCRDELVELDARMARFAKNTDGIDFIDAEDVIDPGDVAHYASDNTHPSPLGSALIANHLAQRIMTHEGRSQKQDDAL